MSDEPTLHDQSVLVTGGHGFIGRHVVAALSRAGAKPISVAHPEGTILPGHPGETLVIDLEERSRVVEAVKGASSVIHLAAHAGGIQFQKGAGQDVFAANRRITDNVLAACVESKVHRLFLASSMVAYRPSTAPLAESDALLGPDDRPTPYAWSKITDEVVASWLSELDVVVGRFGIVYGPGAPFDRTRSTVIHALIDRASRLADGEDLVVWGDGTAVRSFVFAEDAARAVLDVLTHGDRDEAYNIDSGVEVTIAQVASQVRDLVNPSLVLLFDPSQPAGAPCRLGSIAKAAALGYSPLVPLPEGLRQTVDWYRSHPR